MERVASSSAHRINGTVYCVVDRQTLVEQGRGWYVGSIVAFRIRAGKVVAKHTILTHAAVIALIPGMHHRFAFLDYKQNLFLFTPPRTVQKVGHSQFDYASLSPDGHLFVSYIQDKGKGQEVYDLRTNSLVWRKLRAALPVWSLRGNHLVYLNLPGDLNNDYRYDLHAVTLGTSQPPISHRITMQEAVRLLGGWYPAYVKRCFDFGREIVEAPFPYQLLQSPDGQGVAVTMLTDKREKHITVEGLYEVPGAPNGWEDYETSIYHINNQGHIRRFADAPLSPICWSEDGTHIYGSNIEMTWTQPVPGYHPRLCRMSLATGRVASVRLPKDTYKVLTFIED